MRPLNTWASDHLESVKNPLLFKTQQPLVRINLEKLVILTYNIVTPLIKKGITIMYTNNEEFEKMLETIDIDKEPPADDTERQYYFIKKARKYVKEESKKLGRPLLFATVTFGCQMNPVSLNY